MLNLKNTRIYIALSLLSILSTNLYAAPSQLLKEKMQNLGTIKEIKEVEGGLTAWTLEKNGKTLVLYTTGNEKYFIKGSIYDVNTKQIVSDKYALNSLQYASNEFRSRFEGQDSGQKRAKEQVSSNNIDNQAMKIGYMNLKYSKPIPEALKLVESLTGAKEGSGKPQDTLYIIYDPRCPWCHRTFEALRPYVKKGYTVKWIPTLALQKTTDEAINLAAAPLDDSSLLAASFNFDEKLKIKKASIANKKALENNLQFLFAYFKQVKPNENPSVPIGFFLDKTTGKLTDIQGIQEDIKLKVLFGSNN